MTKKELQIMHKLLLDELKWFDEKCKEIGVLYFLSSGSLLGAIRHDGFIPWDDDLDIMLTRENYDKLLEHRLLFSDTNHSLINYVTDRSIPIIYSHLIDKNVELISNNSPSERRYLHLDIYACDYIKNTRFARSRLADRYVLLLTRIYSYRKGFKSTGGKLALVKSVVLKLGALLTSKYSDEQFAEIILKAVVSSDPTDLMAPVASPYGFLREAFPATYYTTLINHRFEDTEAPITAYSDAVLSKLYGDYMKYPPANNRYSEISNIEIRIINA